MTDLLRHRVETLRLREDAPFPSDLREMVKLYGKDSHASTRPDAGNGGRRPFRIPILTLVGKQP